MPHALASRRPADSTWLVLPIRSALLLTATALLSVAIALRPIDPPPAPLAVAEPPVAAPVEPGPPTLVLPGPLPPLRHTVAPPPPTSKAPVARKPARPGRPEAEVVARWEAHSQTLLHLKVDLVRALRAVLLPPRAPALAVAVPADPDGDAPAAPAPAEPPATPPQEPDQDQQADDPGDESAMPDHEDSELVPDGGDGPEDSPDESPDDDADEDDGDLRPLHGAKA